MTRKKALIIGSGLGGLSTALRLQHIGFDVTVLEKHSQPGGRLNQLKMDGYTFDVGPSFMSMTFELEELFKFIGEPMPVKMQELEPLYNVFFEGREKPFSIYKDLHRLEQEFAGLEPGLAAKAEQYLLRAGQFFHDTEDKVVHANFESKLQYIAKLTRVPLKHLPYLFRTMWDEVDKTFTSEEVKIIFSLVAFFLGSTPFKTPAIYSLLNYTEMKHNGYWKVEGGMYALVEAIMEIMKRRNIRIVYNTEITGYSSGQDSVHKFMDQNGNQWEADVYVCNSDAAFFRGKVLGRPGFNEQKLDKLDWTLAPYTMYLGVKGKINTLEHHNYFLGKNFREYADTIFTATESPKKPYYYVNVSSRSWSQCAPEGCENLFILCPVPDMRYKSDWADKESFGDTILQDLSERCGFDIQANTVVKKILAPDDWATMFNLYKGSGLGLAHGMDQVGAFRPKNKDEEFSNLYYVGASTTPGTGLPMVVISSKLVTERIGKDYGLVS